MLDPMSDLTRHVFIGLLTAHMVGDFVLQTKESVSKKHHPDVLIQHALVLGVLSYLLCGLWARWEIPLVIFVSHAGIDFVKARAGGKGLRTFLVDQAAHFFFIIALSVFVTGGNWNLVETYWGRLLGDAFYVALVVVAGAITAVRAGAMLIGIFVRPYQEQLSDSAEGLRVEPGGRGFQDGGFMIGQLERGLIFLFVMVGEPAGIGFLIAAKALFRFGVIKDSKNRMETQYIIIGTLASFLFAVVVSYATTWMMAWVRGHP